jgi:tellurite methyltransferase
MSDTFHTSDPSDQQAKWNLRYASSESEGMPQPAAVLNENRHLLPESGTALDLACGLGGNALLLAQRGLQTHAWDVSNVAIEKLNGLAVSQNSSLKAAVRDVVSHPPSANSFDVIVVSRFLHRPLVADMIRALKPSGLLFYQTFIRDKSPEIGPGNPEYLLAENELLQLFSELRILVYREEGLVGDTSRGFRNEAMLVAQQKH